MAKQSKNCNHVLANGVLCGAKPLRDNDFCYWHHKARTNLRARTTSDTAETGIFLPLLEDANGIQMALQQITQAILDGRLDNRRAGLLLYSLQLAMTNVKNVQTDPDRVYGDHSAVIALSEEEPSGFNDALNGNPCLGQCTTCAEPDCSDRVLPQSPEPTPAPSTPAPIVSMKIQASVDQSQELERNVILSEDALCSPRERSVSESKDLVFLPTQPLHLGARAWCPTSARLRQMWVRSHSRL